MDNCAASAGCNDVDRVSEPASDDEIAMECRRAPRDLPPSLRHEMLLLAHADFALLHHRDKAPADAREGRIERR